MEGQLETLQRRLQEKGFYSGPVDGVAGPQTRSALQSFHRAQASLASAGRLSEEGASALGLDSSESEIERVRGRDEPQREPARGQEPSPDTEDQPQQRPTQEMQPRPGPRGEPDGQRGRGDDATGTTRPEGSGSSPGSPNDATRLH